MSTSPASRLERLYVISGTRLWLVRRTDDGTAAPDSLIEESLSIWQRLISAACAPPATSSTRWWSITPAATAT